MGQELDTSAIRESSTRVIQRSDSFRRSTKGVRDLESQFSRTLEAVLTAMLLHPETFYYLQTKHRNQLLKKLDDLVTHLESAILALADTAQGEFLVRGTSELKAASSELGRAAELGASPLTTRAATARLGRFLHNSLAKNLRGPGGSLVRPAPQARADLQTHLEAAAKLIPYLQSSNTSGVGALVSANPDPSLLRARVLPSILASAKSLVDESIKSLEAGDFLKDPQKHLASLLSIPGVLAAVQAARDPRDPVVQPLMDQEDAGPYPAGSALELVSSSYLEVSITSSRTPDPSMPDNADLVYRVSGSGDQTTVLHASGRNRLVPPGARITDYEITVPWLLLELDGLVYELPLTTGTRTPAQVVADLEAGLASHFAVLPDVRFDDLRDRLYISTDTSHRISLPSSGPAVKRPTLETGVLTVFPLALLGLTLRLAIKRDSTDGEFSDIRVHTFGPGPFGDLSDIIADLVADVAFATDLVFADVGGALEVRLTSPYEYGGALKLDETPGTAVSPVLLSFDIEDISGGSVFRSASAAEELGFNKDQGTVLFYSAQEVAELINETVVGLTAEGVRETVASGQGDLSSLGGTRARLATSDDLTEVQVGDAIYVDRWAGYVDVVDSAALEAVFDGAPVAGHVREYEVVSERITLQTVAGSTRSSIDLRSGTALDPLGLTPGFTEGAVDDYVIAGRLEGQSVSAVQDPLLLGVPDNAVANLTDNTLVTPGRIAHRALLEKMQRLLRDPLYQLVQNFSLLAEKALSAGQLSELKSRAINESMRDMALLLGVLDRASPQRAKVLSALQRLGIPVGPSPDTSMKDILQGFNPDVDVAYMAVGKAAIKSLESRGYDRAAVLLVEGRYAELAALTADKASHAGRVALAFRGVGQRLIDTEDLRTRKVFVNRL